MNCSSYLDSGTCELFLLPLSRETRTDPENFAHSLVTGGQVSRVDPESTGLNPAWRKSLVLAEVGTAWQDGADLAEIQAARQLVIQNMKILEGIAPESGAYLNEVRESNAFRPRPLQPHFFFPSGFEIRIQLEEILLRDSLRQAPSHQAEVRSEIALPHLRRCWVRRVGRRSRLPSIKPLL